jgi:integrase
MLTEQKPYYLSNQSWFMARLFESADSFVTRKNAAKTRATYRYALLLFGQMKFGDLPNEEMFKKLNIYIKKANLQTVIDDIYLFRDDLTKKNLSIRTKHLYTAALQSWFSSNNLQIPKSKSRELRGHIRPVTDDKAFTHETARRTFDQMKSHVSRCFFLFLLSTGCRMGEALQVKLTDVNWESDPVTVTLDETTTKTGENRQVFLTTEAANYIKTVWLTPSNQGGQTLNNRQRYIKAAMNKTNGLIASGAAKNAHTTSDDDDRLWPFTHVTAHRFITTAILRAGQDEKTKNGILKLHPHSTRKFFRTVFGMAAGPDTAETLLGHSPGLTASYRRLETPELIKIWKKHEIALHINISQEARIALQTRDFNAMAIVEIQEENKKLKQAVDRMGKLFNTLLNSKMYYENGEELKFTSIPFIAELSNGESYNLGIFPFGKIVKGD